MAQPTATNSTAPPIQTADPARDPRWGITPVWNPMIILAFFYIVLFLIFAVVVGFIFVRRRRRALAFARGEEAAAAATAAGAGHDPEKAQASVSGDSDVSGDGDGDADKTVFIAQAGAAGEFKASPASDGTEAGSRTTKRDTPAQSEHWTPPPQRKSMPFSSRPSTPMSVRYQCNASELSVAQRETSQVLVWLPSFQSHAGGGVAGPGSGAGAVKPEEGEQSSEKGSEEQEQTKEPETEKGSGEQEREQEREQGQEQEQERVSTKEDSESGCGVAQ